MVTQNCFEFIFCIMFNKPQIPVLTCTVLIYSLYQCISFQTNLSSFFNTVLSHALKYLLSGIVISLHCITAQKVFKHKNACVQILSTSHVRNGKVSGYGIEHQNHFPPCHESNKPAMRSITTLQTLIWRRTVFEKRTKRQRYRTVYLKAVMRGRTVIIIFYVI